MTSFALKSIAALPGTAVIHHAEALALRPARVYAVCESAGIPVDRVRAGTAAGKER